MTDLYHPSRGGEFGCVEFVGNIGVETERCFTGTRGGAAEFKWDNVKGDKDRSVTGKGYLPNMWADDVVYSQGKLSR